MHFPLRCRWPAWQTLERPSRMQNPFGATSKVLRSKIAQQLIKISFPSSMGCKSLQKSSSIRRCDRVWWHLPLETNMSSHRLTSAGLTWLALMLWSCLPAYSALAPIERKRRCLAECLLLRWVSTLIRVTGISNLPFTSWWAQPRFSRRWCVILPNSRWWGWTRSCTRTGSRSTHRPTMAWLMTFMTTYSSNLQARAHDRSSFQIWLLMAGSTSIWPTWTSFLC